MLRGLIHSIVLTPEKGQLRGLTISARSSSATPRCSASPSYGPCGRSFRRRSERMVGYEAAAREELASPLDTPTMRELQHYFFIGAEARISERFPVPLANCEWNRGASRHRRIHRAAAHVRPSLPRPARTRTARLPEDSAEHGRARQETLFIPT